MRRRTFLGTAAATLATAVAGCARDDGGNGDGGSDGGGGAAGGYTMGPPESTEG